MYVHPPIDAVPPLTKVTTLRPDEVEQFGVQTIGEGIAVYMSIYNRQFNAMTVERRARELKRFFRYLQSQNHSMRLSEMRFTDGQGFMDALVNHFDGSELSRAKKHDYRAALRSFSRFLVGSKIIQEDVFVGLKID
jgi:site-specific recombinase XerD